MSLTAFNRVRRMKKIEEMKPENIMNKVEKPIEQSVEEEKKESAEIVQRRRRRN